MSSGYPDIDNISKLERDLINKINNFNLIYSCYLHTPNNPNPNAKYVSSNQLGSCSKFTSLSSDTQKKLLDTTKKEIEYTISKLNNALSNYKGITQRDYKAKFNKLIRNYDKILNERKNMDAKLAELYGTNDGINNFYKNAYTATMFSKIMLTILVTSLVYYTFMKIIKK